MKLTIIGYWGGYPGVDEASSCYLLEKNGYKLALDFGSGALSKIQKYTNVLELDAVILSHYHTDHVADIGVLQHILLVQSYITGHTKKVKIYGHCENPLEFRRLDDEYTEAVEYDPNNALKIGPFFIRFLRTKHPVPCFGMRITDGKSTIVYTGDSAYQDEWIKFSKGADLLLSECNYYKGQDGTAAGHMTSEDVGHIASEADVKEVILTHLPHFGHHPQLLNETKEQFNGKIQLAKEGLIWERE